MQNMVANSGIHSTSAFLMIEALRLLRIPSASTLVILLRENATFEDCFLIGDYLVATEARKAEPNAAVKGAPIPEVHKNIESLKLSFKPVHFPRATLVAVAPAGTVVNGKWTGVERFFSISGVGLASLTEIDLAATKGKYSMLKEAVNGAVNGGPAVSRVFMNELGDSVEEVTWMNANVYSRLTFGPDVVAIAGGAKTKVARAVSGLSLAQEMQ